MTYHAQCNAATNVCDGVQETTGPVSAPPGKYFVPLQFLDESVLGKVWNGSIFIAAAGQPKILSASAFMEHCWTQLGGGATGRARFGKIVRAMLASADDDVHAIGRRYVAAESGGTFSKANVAAFLAILQAKGIPIGLPITDAEEAAILDNWPVG